MKSPVAYCGIVCEGCPIHWATQEKDPVQKKKIRTEIARYSNAHYKTDYTAQDINDCMGCKSADEFLFSGCTECGIRNCAMERSLPNCAHCEAYPCEKLDAVFTESQDSKFRLDFIRSMRTGS